MPDIDILIMFGVFGLLAVYAFAGESFAIWWMDRKGTRPRCRTCDGLIENTYDIFHGIDVCEPCHRAQVDDAYQRSLDREAEAEARRIEAAVSGSPAYRDLLERVQSLEQVNGLPGGKP